MMETKNPDFIFKDIAETTGSDESSKVYLCVNMHTGKSELVIEKTITERHPVQDYEKVMELFNRLNNGHGRKLWRLSELAYPNCSKK